MLAQFRAGFLAGYREVARFVGLDPDLMLRRVGIDAAVLAAPDHLIPGQAVTDLLEESARQSGCMSFGLLMAESSGLSTMGPVSLLLRHQRTARDVLMAITEYQRVINPALVFSIEEVGGAVTIRCDLVGGLGQPQLMEFGMGLLCRAIGEIVAARVHPRAVHFVHPPPDDLGVHLRLFQGRLEFEADFYGFTCSSAALDMRNPDAEASMAHHARRYLDLLLPEAEESSAAGRARRVLYLLLPASRGTLDQTAANLGLHPRALQRQLKREGLTFADLLADVRRELAMRYLANSAHSVTEVGLLTGYASSSSFSRWFAAEFGVSPAAWRAEEQEQAPPDSPLAASAGQA